MSAPIVCECCNEDLSTRPVMKKVRSSSRAPGTAHWIQKRVHCKPKQYVLTVRVEGSFRGPGAVALPPFNEVRICYVCAARMGWSTALAVLLDKRQERGE